MRPNMCRGDRSPGPPGIEPAKRRPAKRPPTASAAAAARTRADRRNIPKLMALLPVLPLERARARKDYALDWPRGTQVRPEDPHPPRLLPRRLRPGVERRAESRGPGGRRPDPRHRRRGLRQDPDARLPGGASDRVRNGRFADPASDVHEQGGPRDAAAG